MWGPTDRVWAPHASVQIGSEFEHHTHREREREGPPSTPPHPFPFRIAQTRTEEEKEEALFREWVPTTSTSTTTMYYFLLFSGKEEKKEGRDKNKLRGRRICVCVLQEPDQKCKKYEKGYSLSCLC